MFKVKELGQLSSGVQKSTVFREYWSFWSKHSSFVDKHQISDVIDKLRKRMCNSDFSVLPLVSSVKCQSKRPKKLVGRWSMF